MVISESPGKQYRCIDVKTLDFSNTLEGHKLRLDFFFRVSQLFPLQWFLKNPTTAWIVEPTNFWVSTLDEVDPKEVENDTGLP